MKNSSKILIILLSILIISAAVYTFQKQTPEPIKPLDNQISEDTPEKTEDPTPKDKIDLVGGDRDSHGCIGSAGYSWCEVKQKCLRPFEELCITDKERTSAEEQVKSQIVEKRGNVAKDMIVTVKQVDGDYLKGSVDPKDPGAGGGLWFAAKNNDKWVLLFDGNGIIKCSDFSQFPKFSPLLAPECVDDNGNLLQRE